MLIAKYNLVEARARLEVKLGREVLWNELAQAFGVTPTTMSNLKNGVPLLRIELPAVAKMLDFFRSQGVELTFYDLVTIEDVSEGEAIKEAPASEALTSPVAA